MFPRFERALSRRSGHPPAGVGGFRCLSGMCGRRWRSGSRRREDWPPKNSQVGACRRRLRSEKHYSRRCPAQSRSKKVANRTH